MTIIEPKKDIPFYIFGLGDTVTLCYLNENLEVLQKIPSPDLSYSCLKLMKFQMQNIYQFLSKYEF